jgi:hypothetical protein
MGPSGTGKSSLAVGYANSAAAQGSEWHCSLSPKIWTFISRSTPLSLRSRPSIPIFVIFAIFYAVTEHAILIDGFICGLKVKSDAPERLTYRLF